jgi:hypothetical protein
MKLVVKSQNKEKTTQVDDRRAQAIGRISSRQNRITRASRDLFRRPLYLESTNAECSLSRMSF